MKKKVQKLFLQNKKRSLKKIVGTFEKPRLSIFRSNKHIYAQLIDDVIGKTIVSSSTLDKDIKDSLISSATKEASKTVGNQIAKYALLKNISKIVFDRGNHPYHGRVEALAIGARESGLVF